jgi:hypothetical protein
MRAIIKLFTTVVNQHLQNACQTNRIVRRWQGGFVPGEECPLHVASIFDIVGRRKALGLPTYAGFTNLRKACDNIPNELLYSKLEANAITGHMLSFILKALYRDSIVQVKSGEAPGILSDTIHVHMGLRQGCSSTTPILFYISENIVSDIVYLIEGLGCEVPCCVDVLDSRQLLRVPCQSFADDTVGGWPCAVSR